MIVLFVLTFLRVLANDAQFGEVKTATSYYGLLFSILYYPYF